MNNKQPKKVAILIYPNLCTFEFGCAIELFALKRPNIKNWYITETISLEKIPSQATGGIQVQGDTLFSPSKGFNDYDMVVIAGWSGVDVAVSNELKKALTDFNKTGGRLVSFCSGVFALASSGLLDGKTATTHWRYQERFRELYPQIHFQENVLYTQEDQLYTSAGSASALDLGLHLIRKDYGSSIANQVAKRLVISPRREGGQAQYANQTSPTEKNLLSSSLEWSKQNLHQSLTVNQMAEKACLSRRSFDRHFRNSLGISPKEWLTRQRIDLARDYLESSTVSIDRIAEDSGFGSAMNLRHHFRQLLGVSPTHYRKQFSHE